MVSFHYPEQSLEYILNEFQVVAEGVGIKSGNWTHKPIPFLCW